MNSMRDLRFPKRLPHRANYRIPRSFIRNAFFALFSFCFVHGVFADEYDILRVIPLTPKFSLVERRLNREQGINPVTDEKIAKIKTWLEELELSLPNFMLRITDKGYGRIFLAKGGMRVASVRPYDKSINVTSDFFAPDDYLLSIGDRPYGQVVLLHELTHAFDEDEISFSPRVLALMGWTDEFAVNALGKRSYVGRLKNVSSEELEASEQRSSSILKGKGDFYDQLRAIQVAERAFANSKGFPSRYSMTGVDLSGAPRECFAELAAFIFYDPNVGAYLRPEQIEWFKENVLN